MAQLRNIVSIIVVVIEVAVLLHSTVAEEYTVGDDIGWTSFLPGGASNFYSKWAANFTFKVNDILVFNFESGSHTVAIITKANYSKCNITENTPALATGPARVTLNRIGKFYFACTFTGHCSSGQKLSVKVTNSSSTVPAKAPSPLPSGSVSNDGSPTMPGAIAPPPHSSATPLLATFSVLLITIAFYFSFQF